MAKKLAKILGVVFIVVGILGFISNPIVGAMGFFHANFMHNLVHIILGLILVMCGTEEKSSLWLKIVGVVYLLVAILGFMMTSGGMVSSILGIEINSADNWLHLVLALVVFYAGFSGGKMMTGGSQQM